MSNAKMKIRAFGHVHLRRMPTLRIWDHIPRNVRHSVRKAFGGVMPCKDCHVETWHYETYFVKQSIWVEANKVDYSGWKGTGYLCIGCLERRLGRELLKDDFVQYAPSGKAYPIYKDGRVPPKEYTSDRLRSRRGW